MLAKRYMLGGEQSGHIIFLEHHTTGDGIVTALQVLATMRRCGKPLSELKTCMTSYPQVLINVPVWRRTAVEELPLVQEAIRAAEAGMRGKGRILVRLSGTEPVARVMVEGEELTKIERVARTIAMVIERELS